jgi:hypothetical protein
MTHSDMKVEVQRLHCSRAARHMPSGDVSKRTSPLACSLRIWTRRPRRQDHTIRIPGARLGGS